VSSRTQPQHATVLADCDQLGRRRTRTRSGPSMRRRRAPHRTIRRSGIGVPARRTVDARAASLARKPMRCASTSTGGSRRLTDSAAAEFATNNHCAPSRAVYDFRQFKSRKQPYEVDTLKGQCVLAVTARTIRQPRKQPGSLRAPLYISRLPASSGSRRVDMYSNKTRSGIRETYHGGKRSEPQWFGPVAC